MNENANNKETTILLVDDTPANLELLLTFLGEKGYTTSVAKNGKTALKRAQYLLPDIILLDIQMPEMDGYETCRRLKQIDETKDIPVIFLSALSDTKNKLEGLNAGGVDYITKPFDMAKVLSCVKLHLTTSKLQKEIHELKNNMAMQVAEKVTEIEKITANFNKDQILEFVKKYIQ